MHKLLLTCPIPPGAADAYAGRVHVTVPDADLSYDEMTAQAACHDAVLLMRNHADAAFIRRNRHLRVIANFGVGYDNIDVDCATALGIPVVNTPHSVTAATAELAVALMLCAMRGVTRHDKRLRDGVWDAPLFPDSDQSAFGAALGIVGLGRIGRRVALAARALGMTIYYHNRRRLPPEDEAALGACYLSLEELLRTSDCISLHLPYTGANKHMFGRAEFAQMKPTAYFINTARGALVREADLVDALKNGVIRGAGLDVYEDEPRPSPGLLALDNVTLCPHVGSGAMKPRLAILHEALDGACAVLDGGRPDNVVNPEVLK